MAFQDADDLLTSIPSYPLKKNLSIPYYPQWQKNYPEIIAF